MDASKYNRRVEFQRLTDTKDSLGQNTEWESFYSCWAAVVDITGAMVIKSGQPISKSTYKITIRYNPDVIITAENRIFSNRQAFEILSVSNVKQENIDLELLCVVINEQN